MEETIVWLDSADNDIRELSRNTSSWLNRNHDVWNFSSRLDEYANRFLKKQDDGNRDYQIPDNLAQYAEEYFEDYKSIYGDYNTFVQHPIQCLPLPSESFLYPLSILLSSSRDSAYGNFVSLFYILSKERFLRGIECCKSLIRLEMRNEIRIPVFFW